MWRIRRTFGEFYSQNHSFKTRPSGRSGTMIRSRVRWVDPGQQKKKNISREIFNFSLMVRARFTFLDSSFTKHETWNTNINS
jgi:hypothetical protein